MNQPRWLTLAWADLGVLEAPGSDNNPKVVRYYADAGHPGVRGEGTRASPAAAAGQRRPRRRARGKAATETASP